MKRSCYSLVIFSMDSHPPDHISFAKTHEAEAFTTLPDGRMVWPEHCVEDTPGCELHPRLSIPASAIIVKKGVKKDVDAYSCFFGDDGEKSTSLKEILEGNKITHVTLCGLAFDVCVKASAIDASRLGFKTSVLRKATRAVHEEDEMAVRKELEDHGVDVIE